MWVQVPPSVFYVYSISIILQYACEIEQRLARQAHNLKAVGSIPTLACIFLCFFYRGRSSIGRADALHA